MVQLTLSEPPDGLSIQKITPNEDGLDIMLHADAAKLKPGWKGNAIVEASVDRVPDAKNAKFKAAKRRVLARRAAGGAVGNRGEVKIRQFRTPWRYRGGQLLAVDVEFGPAEAQRVGVLEGRPCDPRPVDERADFTPKSQTTNWPSTWLIKQR